MLSDLESCPLLTSNRNDNFENAGEISLQSLNTESQEQQTEREGFQRFIETETETLEKELFQQLSNTPGPSPEDKEVPHIPLPPGKKHHLFVSYSVEDHNEATNICEELKRRFNLKCMNWYHDFHQAKTIEENIRHEMQQSVKFLLLMSTSYFESFWCVNEAREACQQTFTEKSNVIPVLLNPLNTELPIYLSSCVYIDKGKEEDVAAKIYEVFNRPETLDQLQLGRPAATTATHNGALICQKVAEKAKFAIHGLAFRFAPLEKYELGKATQFDISQKQFENHYITLTTTLNNKFLFRNYQVLTTVEWRCMALLFLFLVAVAIEGSLVVLSKTNIYETEKYKTFNLITLTVGSAMTISIVPIGFCIIHICRRVLCKDVHLIVLKYNLMFYKESKCLVYFDNSCLSKPTISLKIRSRQCKLQNKYYFSSF
ncbi:uncharacterized protein LOC133187867 [Saccostrea echinata]|uniref:uncharacterized protein LOC133187867 n=1 Tax=Saccostrea echinata TaxID=191078 RepID=UPI002A82BEF2|nr:uncharacterized protein LOC133187867 [Saccostrea echinata]